MLLLLFSIVSLFLQSEQTFLIWVTTHQLRTAALKHVHQREVFAGKTGTNDYEFLFHMMTLTWFSYVPLQIWFLFLLSHFQNGPMGSKQFPAVAWVCLWNHQCSLKDSWHRGPCWCHCLFSCVCLHTQAINANVETITLKVKRKRGSY